MASNPFSLPAPVGGWDAKNSLGEMPPENAVFLNNWFPRPSDVMLRNGYRKFATGLGGQVNAVMSYNAGENTKLFAASGANIYDVTAGGAVGAPVWTTATSDKWYHTNVATPGGNFLYLANGVDKPLLYNGTTWTAIDGASTPAITGVTTTLLTHPYVAKQRVWFIETRSLRAWYLPVISVGGAANSLDFGSLCRRGGYLVSMAEWTVEGGFGMSDYVAFITSEGEMLIYSGTDPSNSAAWSLLGIWYVGSPIGRKCFTKFGSDLLLITQEGLTPMSQGRFFAELGNKGTLTDNIQWAISAATSLYGSNFGWQAISYPLQNALLLNVPVSAGLQEQYVQNTVTGAWCRFTGWAANAWEMSQDQIYFGGNGYVGQAWYGNDDSGVQINGDALQAFNYFGLRGKLKRYTMMRPIVSSNGQPAIYANVNVDFDTTAPSTSLTYSAPSGSVWGSSIWGAAKWGGGSNSIYKSWNGINGIGYAAAPRFMCAAKGTSVTWISTDIVMEPGAIL
jgi:hypothetical protein